MHFEPVLEKIFMSTTRHTEPSLSILLEFFCFDVSLQMLKSRIIEIQKHNHFIVSSVESE